jgi:3-oxoadipate enol-lactonase
MKFEEKAILAAGIHVSYIDEAVANNVAIIFIHGFPFNKWTWEKQIESLKDNYRVIAYDVRGHGESVANTAEMTINQLSDDLFLFMDALQIKSAIVCGLSMGGYIALNAVIKQPARIDALILCDTQCGADSEQARMKRMDVIESIQKNGLKQYAHDSVQKLFCEVSLVEKPTEVSFIEQTILHTPAETIVNTLKALADRKETCSRLYQISIPVLILVGEGDQVTPPELAQKLQQLITGSTLQIIEKAGHLTNLENPTSFNQHAERFLTAIEQITKRL